MYFILEVIFSLTKHDGNISKSSEMCETLQIWRKSLSFQCHGQGPHCRQEGARPRQPSDTESHISQVCWGHPYLQLYSRVRELVIDQWIVHRVIWASVWLQLPVELLHAW